MIDNKPITINYNPEIRLQQTQDIFTSVFQNDSSFNYRVIEGLNKLVKHNGMNVIINSSQKENDTASTTSLYKIEIKKIDISIKSHGTQYGSYDAYHVDFQIIITNAKTGTFLMNAYIGDSAGIFYGSDKKETLTNALTKSIYMLISAFSSTAKEIEKPSTTNNVDPNTTNL
jgi:hypothetical protein